MNLNHLYYFKMLAETEHYTQAANMLDITQPSLSHAISQLENELNCYLFEKQGSTSALLDGLEEEKYDLVLCSYQENRNNINFVPITTEELVVVVSKLNPLALKNEIDLQELQNEYFIYYSKHSGLRPLIDDLFHSNNIDPNILFEVEEDSAILGLVDINYGVAVVPNIPMIDHFHLKKLKIKNPQKKRIIYMATVKNRYAPPAVHSFCNFIVQNSNID